MDREAAAVSLGDRKSYVGHLGDLLPPTLPSRMPPTFEAALTLAENAALKYRSDEWATEFELEGFRQGYERDWASQAAMIEVQEFSNHSHAVEFHDWADGFSCRFSSEAFAVAGVPGATGLQILYDSGRVQERVSFVRGRRRFAVSVNTFGAPPDSGALLHLAFLANTFAR